MTDLHPLVRRDGRVCVRTIAGPILVGYVHHLNANDGPAWSFSRTGDPADAEIGGIQRHQAVKALIAELVSQGRGRRS